MIFKKIFAGVLSTCQAQEIQRRDF